MTLLEFVRLLRHNLRLIALTALAGLILAAGYAWTRPVVYQSSATGIIVAGEMGTIGSAMTGSALAQERAQTYATLAGTGAVRHRIMQQPEIQANPAAAAGGVSANVMLGTPMLTVAATGSSAENAQTLANAALAALAEEALNMEAFNPGGQPGQTDKVVVRLAAYTPAEVSATPISPNWRNLLVAGFGAGLLLGLFVAFARKYLDVRVRTTTDLEELTGHAVLGIIPDTKELGKHREGAGGIIDAGRAGEALRQLRTNLRFVNVDSPPRAIVVTSPNPGEGKSTISSNLAVLLARSGQRVVLIDADLRKPVQHKIFAIDSKVGLTQVLAGDLSVEDALVQTDEPRLHVLVAGRIPPNPSELVGSNRMRHLIDDLAVDHTVILDAPPILAVTDAGLIGTATDGVILVSRVGKTLKEQVRLAAKLLDQVGASLLGNVAHRAPRKSMGDVVYGAGYGGKYQSYYGDYYTEPKQGRPGAEAEAAAPVPEAAAEEEQAVPARRAPEA